MTVDTGSVREIWPEDYSGAKTAIPVTVVSAFLFYLSSLVCSRLIPERGERQPWRWKNISVSCLHSFLSGLWAVGCFYENPKMAEDLISTHSKFSQILVSMSVGYFVYDIIDMLWCQRSRQTFELVLHHMVIICCFGITMVTKLYIGYAVVALLVEINSVFLHIRQLLQVCGYNRRDPIFQVNSIINLATFVGCRIITIAWMTRWIVINKDKVPLVFYSIGSIGLAIVMVMNIILFYRLLRSDFLRKKESPSKDE